MKLFPLLFLVTLLLLQLQVYTEALVINESAHALKQMDRGIKEEANEKITVAKINCGYACSRRCSKASRTKVCNRACLACCSRCNCVPPGTYGNKEACPCYATLKTSGNKLKCP